MYLMLLTVKYVNFCITYRELNWIIWQNIGCMLTGVGTKNACYIAKQSFRSIFNKDFIVLDVKINNILD